jgi:hypothetical protein
MRGEGFGKTVDGHRVAEGDPTTRKLAETGGDQAGNLIPTIVLHNDSVSPQSRPAVIFLMMALRS